MSSCEKDEFMGNSIKPAKVTEVKKILYKAQV